MASAAPMAATVRLQAYGLTVTFAWQGLSPLLSLRWEGGRRSPCASVVMPWDALTPGDMHWLGDTVLAPTAWHDGLQGSPCPSLSLSTGHWDRLVSVGHCAPWGEEVAPVGPQAVCGQGRQSAE